MLFQMRCYWSKSIGWSIGKYRMEYRELNLLFLNHNFSILPDTRIGPYRGVSAYRAVSDTGTAPILKYRWFIGWRLSRDCEDVLISMMETTGMLIWCSSRLRVGDLWFHFSCYGLCLVLKFLSPNFTIHLSHQIFCLMHRALNVGK